MFQPVCYLPVFVQSMIQLDSKVNYTILRCSDSFSAAKRYHKYLVNFEGAPLDAQDWKVSINVHSTLQKSWWFVFFVFLSCCKCQYLPAKGKYNVFSRANRTPLLLFLV